MAEAPGQGHPKDDPGNIYARLDHHGERLVRLEAHREHDRERIEHIRQGLVEADQKIEDRFRELEGQIHSVQKTVNRTYWLVLGGFSVIVTLGGITLWAIRISNGLATLAGGG
jgi:hypothetical protein